MKYLITPFKKYFVINEKSSLKEFWYFFLILTFLINPFIGFFKGFFDINYYAILTLRIFFLIPFLTLGFRRLNETKFSKWLFLIPFVNLILASFPVKEE